MRFRTVSALCTLVMLFSVTSCSRFGRTPLIKIGYVNPTTGALSGNGEGYDWVIDQIYNYVDSHPISINGKKADFEIIVYDSKSDPAVCAQMAERLVLYDKVDLLIATQTPETVIPVTGVAEQYKIPCVSIQAPVDPVAHARDSYEWTYHAFWTIDKIYECYRGLWTNAGFGIDSGAKIGTLFANDADGSAWHDIFVKRALYDGYVVVDPGQYPVNNDDFSAIAQVFKDEGINVLTGTNLPPDFINAMNTFLEFGVSIDCITMGKCCLMYSDASALGESAIGIMSEIWWNDTSDYVSDLLHISSSEIGRIYEKENFGRKMPQPAGYAFAALELAVHTFQNAGSKDKKKLREALSKLDVQTIIGPICYNHVMDGLHYSETIVGGGQWQFENGELVLKVIDNSVYSAVKIGGSYKRGNITTQFK